MGFGGRGWNGFLAGGPKFLWGKRLEMLLVSLRFHLYKFRLRFSGRERGKTLREKGRDRERQSKVSEAVKDDDMQQE
jgi:hypothetical protein